MFEFCLRFLLEKYLGFYRVPEITSLTADNKILKNSCAKLKLSANKYLLIRYGY